MAAKLFPEFEDVEPHHPLLPCDQTGGRFFTGVAGGGVFRGLDHGCFGEVAKFFAADPLQFRASTSPGGKPEFFGFSGHGRRMGNVWVLFGGMF
jgi:hypothetical protein